MSVINKMLRDLDARHAAEDRRNLPNEVRPLPPEPQRTSLLVIVGAVVLVLGVAGAAWWMTSEEPRLAPPVPVAPPTPITAAPAPQAPPPNLAPVVAPEPAPQAAVVPSVVTPPVAPAAEAKPPAPSTTASKVDSTPKPTGSLPSPSSESATKKADTSTAKHGAVASVSSLRLDTSLRQIPSMAETAAPIRPVEKQVRSGGTGNERAEAAYRKAIAANQQGRAAEAAERAREALKEDPRHAAARQLLLSMLVERRQWDEAIPLLREGLDLMPQQSSWAMALARIEVEKGQTAQAWETLQRYLSHAENNADYRGFAGAVLQRLQRSKEATSHYQAAVRLRPGEARWWLGLGLALEADGHGAEAREAFQKAQAAGNLTPEGIALVEQKLR